MSKDKREGWLKDLKVGDKVLVERGRMCSVEEDVIAKITPTGRMTTEKAGTYDHRGNRYPYQRYYYARLREWTEKEALAIRTAELVGRLKYKISEVIKMRNHIEWDVEDLETVWNILKKYERKEDD